MTTIDLKRVERRHYTAGADPELIQLPAMSYLMIDGFGDPGSVPAYIEAIETLYPVSYTIRTELRDTTGVAYVVAPLEGLWWSENMESFTADNKDEWLWTMMIRQPDDVTTEMAAHAIETVSRKKRPAAGDRIRFDVLDEALAAQVMHRGPYRDEGPTVRRLHDFIADQDLERVGKHHEIYLSDPRKTAPEKMRTVIRQPVI